MKFGIGTVLWGRRIDDLDYCLDVIQACGYKGVEFAQHFRQIFIRGEDESVPTIRCLETIEELLAKLSDRDLELLGLVGGTLDERREFLGNHRGPYLYVDRWPNVENEPEFHAQVQRCIEAGHTVALHPHWLTDMYRAGQAIEHIKRSKSPYLRLLLDTAHAVIAEDDPAEIVSQHYALLCAIHIKGWKPDYGRWSHRYAHGFCLPGEGIVDVEGTLSELKRRGYVGWVVLEQDYFQDRRERTMADGAKWMELHGPQWGIKVDYNAAKLATLLNRERRNPFVQFEEVEDIEASLARKLARFVEHQPDGLVFYREVASELRSLLNVAAVKIWSRNPMTEEFCLIGMSTQAYPTPECGTLLDIHCPLVAEFVSFPHVCEHSLDHEEVQMSFADREWLARVRTQGAHWMTLMPVFNSGYPLQLRYLISIFSSESLLQSPLADNGIEGLPKLQEVNTSHSAVLYRSVQLERFGWIIAQWADYLINELCLAAAGSTNHLCGSFTGKVSEFMDELRRHIHRRFHCNCVTVFLEDMTGKWLEPAGSSDQMLSWTIDKDGKPVDHHYDAIADNGRYTWQAWQERRMVFSSDAKDGKAREKRPEEDHRDEILFAPLSRRNGKCFGVARLHNKIASVPYKVATMFTDDDAAHLDAIIQSALPHLELLHDREAEKEGISQMVHEFQTPMVAIRAAVDAMKSDLSRGGHDPKQLFRTDFLEMILNWANSMGHLARNAQVFSAGIATLKPQTRKTYLRKEVVLPVLHQIRPLLRRGMSFEFHESGFEDVPLLFVDPYQLQSVFFNLISNACKYCRSSESVRVHVTAGKMGEHYCIWVSDWGMGISEEIKEKIFRPKFRAQDALISNVSGQGLGLYVVRSIVEAHGGTVTVSSCASPTTFEIMLPSSLRYAVQPKRS